MPIAPINQNSSTGTTEAPAVAAQTDPTLTADGTVDVEVAQNVGNKPLDVVVKSGEAGPVISLTVDDNAMPPGSQGSDLKNFIEGAGDKMIAQFGEAGKAELSKIAGEM